MTKTARIGKHFDRTGAGARSRVPRRCPVDPSKRCAIGDISTVVLPDGTRAPCRAAVSHGKRLKGLLGTKRAEVGNGNLLLVPCSSVHTFGMRYAIDVAFIDAKGVVTAVFPNVRPCRVLSCPKALAVLERPSCADAWLEPGDVPSFRLGEDDRALPGT